MLDAQFDDDVMPGDHSVGIKMRAEGHDGTWGEGRGRPHVAATDDQEQGREEGGTHEGNTDGTDTG